MGKSVTYNRFGLTGVLLDPPYDQESRDVVYANESNVSNDVRDWALENGDNPLLRIALCGYDTEHETLTDAGWTMYRWETQGGYGCVAKSGRGRENAKRETIWFSPHCLPDDSAEQLSLI